MGQSESFYANPENNSSKIDDYFPTLNNDKFYGTEKISEGIYFKYIKDDYFHVVRDAIIKLIKEKKDFIM